MKYYYNIILYLADEEKRKAINLDKKDWETCFKEAENHYNLIGKSARNIKRIVHSEVCEKEIKIRLESDCPLEKPTLALRAYSQFLVHTGFGKVATNNNALFRGSFEAVETEKEDMTGSEMIKTLAEIVIANRKSDAELLGSLKRQLMNWRDQ